ncbi:glycosyltransferase family 4 protein [Chryseolinea sp. H1M3-3]|uniref:glycosyltransferase family 4 protein n=1 Tax=Chryseolinea sp. H1M3-3 TaxID=3034144 RepID=UPI0023EB8BE5|nr:glycosyltransferase family 4 protein [Chryseolinea sp. H1M3-3]
MKVLLLHQHFNTPESGGSLRSYYLAKALVDRNVQVVVITGYGGKNYQLENIEGIEVHYLPVPYNNRFGFWKRSFSFFRYNWGVIRLTGKLQSIDTCYAISVPLTIGLAAFWIKLRYKIKYIFEVGDLWPEAPIQMGFVNNYFLKSFLYGLEKFLYRKAESVVALSPMIKAAIEKKVPGKLVHLIPNMADTAFYKPQTKDPVLVEKFRVKEKFVVSYIGAIGLANGLDFYVECARACQQAGLPIHFMLCGDGALLEYFKRIAKQYALKNLSILPFQNRNGVNEIMNVTDATFICYKPLPVLETGSPNKYFDGLAAGKLILVNFGGWIKSEIENRKCGVYVDSKRPTDMVKKIEPFISDSQRLKQYQQASRLLAESAYSRKILGERFASIFMR